MADTERRARKIVEAMDCGLACSPDPSLSVEEAYRIAASVRAIRERRGETTIGRKIGFTNAGIWPQYGIFDPIWGYMYDGTVMQADPNSAVGVSSLLEPRIEPEICFGLSAAVTPEMDDDALLEHIAWVAHGFEIVQSLYPEWKLSAADAIAACGMHGFYLLGEKHELSSQDRSNWAQKLTTVEVELACNGKKMDCGSGKNVLGSPLSALRHLIALLDRDAANPALAAGEIVTTGTITGAFPVAAGEVWSTKVSGLPLAGLSVRIA